MNNGASLETAAGPEKSKESTAAEDRREILNMFGRFVEIQHELKSSLRSQAARAICNLNPS
jgi:hypothetical protein